MVPCMLWASLMHFSRAASLLEVLEVLAVCAMACEAIETSSVIVSNASASLEMADIDASC